MKNRDLHSEAMQRALGTAIRKKRIAFGLSQEAFAGTVELHRTYIGSVERGERNVTFQNLCRIARTLDIKTSELIAHAEDVYGEVAQ